MIGYDNWKSYNYRDNELGAIQDDEKEEDMEENIDDVIQNIKRANMPSDLETELALQVIARQFPNSAMILRLRLGAPFDLTYPTVM